MSQKPLTEDGVVVGNVTDKYMTGNPLYRRLMTRFCNDISALVDQTGAKQIHEVGCGEGNLARLLDRPQRQILATDFSRQMIELAEKTPHETRGHLSFKRCSIYDLESTHAAELILCCEVLEHLDDPETAVQLLAGLARPYAIFSVPREPLWRILNMARGKYLGAFGNTPGHLNHWSSRSFRRMLAVHFEVMEIRTPLPWTIALCRVKA